MRGKQIAWVCVLDDVRNIPAYAGKTLEDMSLDAYDSEHPRVCGENR